MERKKNTVHQTKKSVEVSEGRVLKMTTEKGSWEDLSEDIFGFREYQCIVAEHLKSY